MLPSPSAVLERFASMWLGRGGLRGGPDTLGMLGAKCISMGRVDQPASESVIIPWACFDFPALGSLSTGNTVSRP